MSIKICFSAVTKRIQTNIKTEKIFFNCYWNPCSFKLIVSIDTLSLFWTIQLTKSVLVEAHRWKRFCQTFTTANHLFACLFKSFNLGIDICCLKSHIPWWKKMSACKGIPEALSSITVPGPMGQEVCKCPCDIGSLTVSSVNVRSLIQVFNLQNFLNKTYSQSLFTSCCYEWHKILYGFREGL